MKEALKKHLKDKALSGERLSEEVQAFMKEHDNTLIALYANFADCQIQVTPHIGEDFYIPFQSFNPIAHQFVFS